ncbi:MULTISPECIES: DUF3152 domain-containing protein [unclassified Streptomyces]|uniref:DUF3152 domain-containing protein n=1 Tax=unclassified Streptomyces TaxID=2593676 RepID=UPI0024418836|nr:DUF3152 domain-containing protein [Streptomyces sp. DH41]MDG9724503.1 DUF3152 domain-containing protein [Streptomyces sp. DH41]
MNAHRSTPSPSSDAARRRRGRRARRRRGGRPPLLWVGLAAGVVLLLAGGLVLEDRTQESSRGSSDAAGAPSASERPASREAVETQEAKKDEPGAEEEKETEKSPDPDSIPSSGPGTFATAGGGGDRVGGSGRTLTYVVQVEDGIGISARDVAVEVEDILADERGWTADGEVGFRRVSGGTSDFRVRLATAATVDDICGQYGLDTGGEVNCNVGQDVMVNLKRWLLATQYYADDVTSYRALIINHEVGHFLGHGHEGCPGSGRPAPVMMQQIKGLHGCRTNVWPYDGEGRPVTGPAVG